MQEIDFEEINTWLDHGQLPLIAKQAGISVRQARRIMSGECKNLAFVKMVQAVAMENKTSVIGGIRKMKELNAA